jgi:hypothetical protein
MHRQEVSGTWGARRKIAIVKAKADTFVPKFQFWVDDPCCLLASRANRSQALKAGYQTPRS